MTKAVAGKSLARTWTRGFAALIGLTLVLVGCESSSPYESTESAGPVQSGQIEQRGTSAPVGQRAAFTRQSGNNLRTGQVQVNGYLWRAALDTVSFMPLSSADPYGGAIITDWYTPPETPDERLKVTVLVRGESLVSDGVKVTIFRQTKDPAGLWADTAVDQNTQVDMENIILSQARALRNEAQNKPK